MAEIQGTTQSTAELEERVRELAEENQGLKDQLLEYQYKTGEKPRPLQEITLGEYLGKLNDPKEKGKVIDSKGGFIITDARIVDFSFKYDGWTLLLLQFMPLFGLPYAIMELFGRGALNYVNVTLSDDKGNTAEFRHLCHKDVHPVVEEILNPYVGNIPKVIVRSTTSKNHFIEGLVKPNGEYLRF